MSNCPFCGQPTTGRNRVCDSLECRKRMYDSWQDGQIAVPPEFLPVLEFAQRKGMTVQTIAKNCRKGKYENSFQDPQSGRWYIHESELKTDVSTQQELRVTHVQAVSRRNTRQKFKATDREWADIVEAAAFDKKSRNVNEFLIQAAKERAKELKESQWNSK